jgi:hypothetical protein
MIMYTKLYIYLYNMYCTCSHVDSVLDKTKHYWSRIHVTPYIVQNIHNTCKQSFKELHKLYSIVVLRYFYCFVRVNIYTTIARYRVYQKNMYTKKAKTKLAFPRIKRKNIQKILY